MQRSAIETLINPADRSILFDATKFNWIGSTGAKNSALFVWADNPVKSIVDVLAREVTIGGTGAGASLVVYPTAMNNVLGTKFKVVIGYKSSEDIALAMQRGEVEARVLAYSSVLATHRSEEHTSELQSH